MPDSPNGVQWEPEHHGSHDGDDVTTACEDGAASDAHAGIASSIVSAARPQPITA